jgi:hypothetical protein
MPTFTIIALGPWRKILDRVRPRHLSEIEQCEDRCLEAMEHPGQDGSVKRVRIVAPTLF